MSEEILDHWFMLLQFGNKSEKIEAREMLEAMGFWNDEIPEILNLDSSIESSKELCQQD